MCDGGLQETVNVFLFTFLAPLCSVTTPNCRLHPSFTDNTLPVTGLPQLPLLLAVANAVDCLSNNIQIVFGPRAPREVPDGGGWGGREK